MKLVSWNVNGIRAVMQKDFVSTFEALNADVLCVQETKAQDEQVVQALAPIGEVWLGINSAQRKGYSGTAIISKHKPLAFTRGMGVAEHDNEGRIGCAEFPGFYLVDVYVPNSGAELVRLDYRHQWDRDFCSYLLHLQQNKPVVVCGDFNVAHRPIDIARPQANYNKSAGYTQVEIDGMDRLLDSGLVDTFRQRYPDKTQAYTWWSYRAGAREKNIGWRIDYFLASRSLDNKISQAQILPHFLGSDHCPISIDINL